MDGLNARSCPTAAELQVRFYSQGTSQRGVSASASPLVRQMFDIADSNFISISRLAQLTGYDRKDISYWRSGKKKPSIYALVDLYNALGYDLVPVKRDKQ